MVQPGSSVAVLNSVFEFNFAANSTDGYGIVNFDGRVQCDSFDFGCQPVCTICCRRFCRDDTDDYVAADYDDDDGDGADLRISPTLPRLVRFQPFPIGIVILLLCSSLCLLGIFARKYRGCRNCAALIRREHHGAIQLYTILPDESSVNYSLASNAVTRSSAQETDVEEIVHTDEGESEHTTNMDGHLDSAQQDPAADNLRPLGWPGNRERSLVTGLPQSLPWSIMQASSAPIFVIGRSDMGIVIKLCSTGMSKTIPMHVDPVGRFLTDLPFVNARDGAKWQQNVIRIFEAPAEHDNARTSMLHLCTQNGTMLLEVTLDVFVTASESIIVMTGREVESGLAGLLRNHYGCSGTPSESGARVLIERESSDISSLTMSSRLHESTASSDFVTRGDQNAEGEERNYARLLSETEETGLETRTSSEEQRERAWLSSETEETDLERHPSSDDQGSRTRTSAHQSAQPPTTNAIALANANTITEDRPGSGFDDFDGLDRTSLSTIWSESSRSPMTSDIMVPNTNSRLPGRMTSHAVSSLTSDSRCSPRGR